jgi:phospholipid/cholesterol/gamma-HCH transport system substrate-binding protein
VRAMTKLSRTAIRVISAAVIVAVVAVGAIYVFGGSSSKKLSANFASGVGVYPGTPVKILGIQVGSVTKVSPAGGSVKIEMTYDHKYKVPAGAISVLVANSLVSDRYVQLAPAYNGKGPVLANGANIPLSRTASPAELDDIYGALNQLSVALGPHGANKKGALSTLVNVAAANLHGNGSALNSSIRNLSKAALTLSNGRQDLFGTVKNLKSFTQALSQSDAQVRHFENQLAQVAGDLADERGDLGAALHNLTIALHQVANFVQANAGKVHTDVKGLESVTNVLVKDKAALDEILSVAPVALSNLTHGYQESSGTLGTRSNLTNIADAGQICAVLNQATNGGLLTLPADSKLLGDLTAQIVSTCIYVAGQIPGGSLPTLPGLPTSVLCIPGVLPPIPGVCP